MPKIAADVPVPASMCVVQVGAQTICVALVEAALVMNVVTIHIIVLIIVVVLGCVVLVARRIPIPAINLFVHLNGFI
ncbi:hypothetical protein A2274_00955 [candidate division WWE3 bacterium RIFOXYA12_FULL_43_11]|nr:MAG: hypothetical protein A2274_00955 [candidate division WWE3 bacterium RIFOXYA12_FULL_43_11]